MRLARPCFEPMQEKPRELHYLAKTLLMAIPAISIGIQVSTWIFAISEYKNRVDFFAYYEAGYFLRTGQVSRFYHQIQPPSFGFIHPAYEALLFVPLSLLGPRAAYVTCIVLESVVLYLILRVLRSDLSYLRSFSPIMPWALALAFFPISYTIAQGQDSLLLALLVALAFVQIRSGREFYAGILLGFGFFRFQILIPMAIVFLCWKLWKILAGMFTSAACALCVSLVITGISGQMQYLKLLRLLAEPANQNVQQMTNLRSFLAVIGVTSPQMVLVISAFVLMLIALVGRKSAPACSFLFAVVSSGLLSYHLFLHDFTVLLLPLLIVVNLLVKHAHYFGLSLAAVIIILPEAAMMIGSANALWVCFLVPLLILFILGSGDIWVRYSVPH
jgi:hypothetical protein